MERRYFKEEFPCRVERHPKKGRILISTRDLSAGELIFRERPLLGGPAKTSLSSQDHQVLCLGCLKKGLTDFPCAGCAYPMCSKACGALHSQSRECHILGQEHSCSSSSSGPSYEAILPLRCLLLKKDHPEEWEYFTSFESHLEELKSISCDWRQTQVNVVEQIRSVWGLGDEFTEEEVEMVEGILYINTLEVPAEDSSLPSGRAFYPVTSFASHDCTNNTFRTRTDEDESRVEVGMAPISRIPGFQSGVIVETRAKVDIKAGSEITLHYSSGLKGRLPRRRILREGWFFCCQCERCRCPRELGADLSTLICQSCTTSSGQQKYEDSEKGLLLPVISEFDEGGHEVKLYRCQTCYEEMEVSRVEELESGLISKIESTYSDDIPGLEEVLHVALLQFHPRHYLVLILKWLLLNLYGRKKGFDNPNLNEARIQSKIEFCQDYLWALDRIDPGISHNRGRTYWELYSIRVFALQRGFHLSKAITKTEEFRAGLEGLRDNVLGEVESCLRWSDRDSFEGRIYQLSKKALASLNETLNFLNFM